MDNDLEVVKLISKINQLTKEKDICLKELSELRIKSLEEEVEKLRNERNIYRNGLREIRRGSGNGNKIKNKAIFKIRQRYAGFAEQILDKNSTFTLILDEFNNCI